MAKQVRSTRALATKAVAKVKTPEITTQKARTHKTDLRLKQAEMLLNISRRVATLESLDKMLEMIVELIVWELGVERGSLFLHDPVRGQL